jgi:hypothetical protein
MQFSPHINPTIFQANDIPFLKFKNYMCHKVFTEANNNFASAGVSAVI